MRRFIATLTILATSAGFSAGAMAQDTPEPQQEKPIKSTSQLEEITMPIGLFHAIQQYLGTKPFNEVAQILINIRRVAQQEIRKENRLRKSELKGKKMKNDE